MTKRSIPKLFFRHLNILPTEEEVRALYKGIMGIFTVNGTNMLSYVPIVLSSTLYLFSPLMEVQVEVYSQIEENQVGETIYPFQLYHIKNVEEEEPVKDGTKSLQIPKYYSLRSEVEFYKAAKRLQGPSTWTDGRMHLHTNC